MMRQTQHSKTTSIEMALLRIHGGDSEKKKNKTKHTQNIYKRVRRRCSHSLCAANVYIQFMYCRNVAQVFIHLSHLMCVQIILHAIWLFTVNGNRFFDRTSFVLG